MITMYRNRDPLRRGAHTANWFMFVLLLAGWFGDLESWASATDTSGLEEIVFLYLFLSIAIWTLAKLYDLTCWIRRRWASYHNRNNPEVI